MLRARLAGRFLLAIPNSPDLLWRLRFQCYEWSPTLELQNDYSGWSPPVVAGGVVYYVLYEENNLYAINATSGAEIWNYTPVYTGSSGNGVSLENVDPSAAVVHGVVYLGSDYGNVYAFEFIQRHYNLELHDWRRNSVNSHCRRWSFVRWFNR